MLDTIMVSVAEPPLENEVLTSLVNDLQHLASCQGNLTTQLKPAMYEALRAMVDKLDLLVKYPELLLRAKKYSARCLEKLEWGW